MGCHGPAHDLTNVTSTRRVTFTHEIQRVLDHDPPNGGGSGGSSQRTYGLLYCMMTLPGVFGGRDATIIRVHIDSLLHEFLGLAATFTREHDNSLLHGFLGRVPTVTKQHAKSFRGSWVELQCHPRV